MSPSRCPRCVPTLACPTQQAYRAVRPVLLNSVCSSRVYSGMLASIELSHLLDINPVSHVSLVLHGPSVLSFQIISLPIRSGAEDPTWQVPCSLLQDPDLDRSASDRSQNQTDTVPPHLIGLQPISEAIGVRRLHPDDKKPPPAGPTGVRPRRVCSGRNRRRGGPAWWEIDMSMKV